MKFAAVYIVEINGKTTLQHWSFEESVKGGWLKSDNTGWKSLSPVFTSKSLGGAVAQAKSWARKERLRGKGPLAKRRN